MKNKHFKQNKSFSLIELIISLAILAVVMFLLLPLLYQGIRLWQFDRDSELALKEARLALMRISDEVSQADTTQNIVIGTSSIQFKDPNGESIQFGYSDVQNDYEYQCQTAGQNKIHIIVRLRWTASAPPPTNPAASEDALLYYLKGCKGAIDPNDLKFTPYYNPAAEINRVKIEFNVQRCAGPECGGISTVHHFETATGLRNKE